MNRTRQYLKGLAVMVVLWILMVILFFVLALFGMERAPGVDIITCIYFGITGCLGVSLATAVTSRSSWMVSTWLFSFLSIFVYFQVFMMTLLIRGRGFGVDAIDSGFILGCIVASCVFTGLAVRRQRL